MCRTHSDAYTCRHRQLTRVQLCLEARQPDNYNSCWSSFNFWLTGAHPPRQCGEIVEVLEPKNVPCLKCQMHYASGTHGSINNAPTAVHSSRHRQVEHANWPLPPLTPAPPTPAPPPAAVIALTTMKKIGTTATSRQRAATNTSFSRDDGGFASDRSISRPSPTLPATSAAAAKPPSPAARSAKRAASAPTAASRSVARLGTRSTTQTTTHPDSGFSSFVSTSVSSSSPRSSRKLQKKRPPPSASASAAAAMSAPRSGQNMARAKTVVAKTGLHVNTELAQSTCTQSPAKSSSSRRALNALKTPRAVQSEESFACINARRVEEGRP